jgi:dCTP deaminase
MEGYSVVCEGEIRFRLSKDLVVSPILDTETQIRDCSINLRLGMNLVIPRLTEQQAIDSRKIDEHGILKFQRFKRLSFGEEFVIHTGRLILASTFEFIYLPEDICGFVMSRSSYGRLGLIVATATFVHANWTGCLTLELVNEGQLPIILRCGDAVAQLVLLKSEKIPRKGIKDVPLWPQYRKPAKEEEWSKFDWIREYNNLRKD